MTSRGELREVSRVQENERFDKAPTLETSLYHVKRMSCESGGYASGEASSGLNQRRRETSMVVTHRYKKWACLRDERKFGSLEIYFAEADHLT